MDAVALALGIGCLAMPPGDPPLSDLHRFPPAAVAEPYYKLASAHRDWICQQKPKALTRADEAFWWAWQLEADHCRRAWDHLWDAHRVTVFEVSARRRWLAKLRETIGEQDYWDGRMPPPVPVWRFRRAW